MGRNSIPQSQPQSSRLRPDSRTSIVLLMLIFLLTLFVAYASPMMTGTSLWAPDLKLSEVVLEKEYFPAFFGGGWKPLELGRIYPPLAPTATRLVLLKLVSAETYRYAAFMLDTFLLFLAAAYLLRGKGMLWTTTLIGALAMAFSGQSFTIIAAGHLGKFGMMPCAVFMLAFLDRAVSRQTFFKALFYYALAGCAAAMGMWEQPDVMVLFHLLGGIYLIYKLFKNRGASALPVYLARQGSGIVIAGLVFAAVALPVVMSTLDIRLVHRKDLAEESGLKPYEFATCWSMPPEEAAEFLAPSFFGAQTGDSDLPYWGRLGQSRLGDNNTVKRLNSLRQHNLYLGILQIVFALSIVGMGLTGFRNRAGRVRVPELGFWGWAWLITFLLALGRYTPLYHLFYLLPYVSAMRCPIKFMHLIEVCTVVLFAMGLDRFLRQLQDAPAPTEDARKKSVRKPWRPSATAVFCAIAALLALLAAGIVSSSMSSFREIWSVLPSPARNGQSLFGEYGNRLLANMTWGLLRASILFAVCAAIVEVGRLLREISVVRTSLAVVFGCFVALDMSTANHRYVQVHDMSSLAERNAVLQTLDFAPKPFRVALHHVQWNGGQPNPDNVSATFFNTAEMYGVEFVQDPWNPGAPHFDLWKAIAPDYERYCLLIAADHVFGPAQLVAGLSANPSFQLVAAFDLIPDGKGLYTWRKNERPQGMYILWKYDRALPRASVYYDWKKVDKNDWTNCVADPAWDPLKTVLVEGDVAAVPAGGPTGTTPSKVTSLDYARNSVEIRLTATAEGILLLNDLYHEDWEVLLDGRPAPLLRCNWIMRGVKVSPGAHTVSMRYVSRYKGPAKVQAGVILLLVLLAAGAAAHRLLSARLARKTQPGA